MTLQLRLSISLALPLSISLSDLQLYSKISRTQINSVLDVGYDIDSEIDPWSLQFGYGPTWQHFIVIFNISKSKDFCGKKTPQNATSHFPKRNGKGGG